jgi:hypothetical protein
VSVRVRQPSRVALRDLSEDGERRAALRKARDRWTSSWHLPTQIGRAVEAARRAAAKGRSQPVFLTPRASGARKS